MRLTTLLALGLSFLVSGITQAADTVNQLAPQYYGQNSHSTLPTVPKNIVVMIGDGMGPAYTTAYRYYKDNPETQEIEQTVFDRLLVGMSSTNPAPSSGFITDSAASATALATGYKTYNGAISVDEQKQPLPTLFELAKQRGMATGIAVTSQVNHATPAAFLVHNESRKNYVDIAEDYLQTDADVILGGGQQYFSAKLLEKFIAKGYQHISEFRQLADVTQPKVLGLFAPVQMPWAIDKPNAHQLRTMTQKSLELLSQHQQGFVLLVEGSLIDWAGHSNDIASAMHEMDEFAASIEVVEQYVRTHKDTLLVVTADHNTGGLSVGANGEYAWNPAFLQHVSASPWLLAKQAFNNEQWQQPLQSALQVKLTDTQWQQLTQARSQDETTLVTAIIDVINQHSNTGWTGLGHTASDVQVFATGPGANLFIGHQDNTDIANNLISLLPKSPAEIPLKKLADTPKEPELSTVK
ncbi:alkaline phosphatase [Shewanella intestini]|uniref:Alkaline phosphatase n=1 Tax=Shewanella intestini TaxID=2017544 RepID=A0ABS5I2T6_9GAMM|nr:MULTISPECIES: alkaline phosphatase [Shewanella]MBR9728336.1 alkaline phosphatase [Shewanella intestini]MRG36678.1 alkaline phosphatase [Shewanella sp. XMDDZSB0408]